MGKFGKKVVKAILEVFPGLTIYEAEELAIDQWGDRCFEDK